MMTDSQDAKPEFFTTVIPEPAPIDPELQTALLNLCLRPLRGNGDAGLDGSNRFLFDFDQLGMFGTQKPEIIQGVIRTLATTILRVSESYKLDAVAFIERRAGPLGMLAARASLIEATRLPSIVTRPHMRLQAAKVQPFPAQPNLKVAILTDTTATGQEVYRAAETLWDHRLTGVTAISLFDTNEGARELAKELDIPLTVIMSSEEVLATD